MKAQCRPGEHVDHPLRGGRRMRCIKCGDVFPCRHCEHLDCMIERGEALPEWAGGPCGEEKKSSANYKDRSALEPGENLPTQRDHDVAPRGGSARHEQ